MWTAPAVDLPKMTELERRQKTLTILAGFVAEGGEEFLPLFEQVEQDVAEFEQKARSPEHAASSEQHEEIDQTHQAKRVPGQRSQNRNRLTSNAWRAASCFYRPCLGSSLA